MFQGNIITSVFLMDAPLLRRGMSNYRTIGRNGIMMTYWIEMQRDYTVRTRRA
jgi:hypothetical protein